MKEIIIIGGGASGMMTAATLLLETKENIHISLFEKNTILGKKVLISGGGRCNITTGITDKKILETKYSRGWDFIKKAIGKFSPEKCRNWFNEQGVPLKIEEDMRVFPVSDNGHDVVGVFEKIFAKNRERITIHYGEGVTEVIQTKYNTYRITTPKGTYEADVLIITTGGNAYSQTGSSGDGYAFARSLGHRVTKLGPSLSSFLTKEKMAPITLWACIRRSLDTHFRRNGSTKTR